MIEGTLPDSLGAHVVQVALVLGAVAIRTPAQVFEEPPDRLRRNFVDLAQPRGEPVEVAIRFEDMTEAESAPLLEFLFTHPERPELTCRFRWTKGAVALWDSRCTQRWALNDYHGYRRVMHRVSVECDRPV